MHKKLIYLVFISIQNRFNIFNHFLILRLKLFSDSKVLQKICFNFKFTFVSNIRSDFLYKNLIFFICFEIRIEYCFLNQATLCNLFLILVSINIMPLFLYWVNIFCWSVLINYSLNSEYTVKWIIESIFDLNSIQLLNN